MINSIYPLGKFAVEKIDIGSVKIFYTPEDHEFHEEIVNPADRKTENIKILEVNSPNRSLTIFPIDMREKASTAPKYHQIKRITLAEKSLRLQVSEDSPFLEHDDIIEILEELPKMFTKNPDHGLGLAQNYRFIVDAVEELSDCVEIVISKSTPTGIDLDGKIFNISATDLERARKALNKITRIGQTAARSVKNVTVYNMLAKTLGIGEKPVKIGRDPLRKLITAVIKGEEPLTEDYQAEILSIITQHTKSLVEEKPASLMKLKSNIELVTLERLIEKYKEMINKVDKESKWQSFFNENQFILNMVFGYPVIKVQDQASVGGKKLSGSGEKITDFLIKNSLTNNTAIFEIKTPKAVLLNKNPFRKGVYTPSAELSGSINQALDQKYQFQKEIAQIKENSRIYDIESYAVHCCLIIGQMPRMDEKKKSFEMFRRNSKDVEIVTFDELLEKLKQLRDFLRIADADKGAA